MKKLIATLLATLAFATALTGCGGNKNNSKNESSAQSSAVSQTSEKDESEKDNFLSDKDRTESKAESVMDDAENNGRVRDGDGIIGNEDYENRDDGMTDGMEDYFENGMDNNSKSDDEII